MFSIFFFFFFVSFFVFFVVAFIVSMFVHNGEFVRRLRDGAFLLLCVLRLFLPPLRHLKRNNRDCRERKAKRRAKKQDARNRILGYVEPVVALS